MCVSFVFMFLCGLFRELLSLWLLFARECQDVIWVSFFFFVWEKAWDFSSPTNYAVWFQSDNKKISRWYWSLIYYWTYRTNKLSILFEICEARVRFSKNKNKASRKRIVYIFILKTINSIDVKLKSLRWCVFTCD